MDYFVDVGFAVLLRLLSEGKIDARYRRAFLKLFRVMWRYFEFDEDFRSVVEH